MALGVYFPNRNFTADRYDNAIRQLEAAGAEASKGRSHHVAFETDGELMVFDVWTRRRSSTRSARPSWILTGLGIEVGQPVIGSIHNVIEG